MLQSQGRPLFPNYVWVDCSTGNEVTICDCRGPRTKGGPQPHIETTLLGAEGAEIFGKKSGFLVKTVTFL